MLNRLIQLPKNQNILLFGPRGVGKSTWLRHVFDERQCLWINLLKASDEMRFARYPDDLIAMVEAMQPDKHYVVIDEIQKLPKLLDVVHHLIEEKHPVHFVMTGSSARKLKKTGANLLAGRAFVYHLFPFSWIELGEQFNLHVALEWGLLPKIYEYAEAKERRYFLQAYANTYLKEEIWAEQIVKKLDPFRRFMEVAAQMNAKIINFASIARDVGVSDQAVKEYFSILEDTLIGFFLESFHHSFRKRLNAKPKFYFFDTGVTRALANSLQIPLQAGTSAYGEAFEHFIILECMKLARYYDLDYRFSYLSTKDGAEVDLVVERPGQVPLFIEIKSNAAVPVESLRTITQLAQDFGECEPVCFSQDPYAKKYGAVTVYPWREGMQRFFTQKEIS